MAMRQAVALQPTSTQYRMRLAELWRLVGRPDYAQREIEEALKLSPNDPQIMTARDGAVQRGMVAEGIERCRAAASIAPGSPGPQYAIGLICAGSGRRDESLRRVRRRVGNRPELRSRPSIAEQLAVGSRQSESVLFSAYCPLPSAFHSRRFGFCGA